MATIPTFNRLPFWLSGLGVVIGALAVYGAISVPALAGRWGVSPAGLGVFAIWLALAAAAVPLLRGRPSRRTAMLMIVAIALLRLLAGLLANGRVSPGDAHAYLVLADNIIGGRGYYFDEPYMGVRTWALFPPFYPLLLAGWVAIAGASTWSMLTLATATDGIAAWLIAGIGGRLGNRGAGRAAGFLYLIWPSTLFSAPLAEKEGLCVVLILLLARVWIERAEGTIGGWRGAIALGLPAGMLALTQPGEAPLAALFGIALVGRIGWRRMLGFGMAGAAVTVAVLMPWWVRNWVVFGAFVPLTSAGGISLWIGNNADATGNWMPQPATLHGLPELDYGRRAGALAVAWSVAHPVDFVRLTLTKFVRAFGVGQFGLVRLAAMYPPISAMLAAMLFPLSHGAHLLMLAGAAAATRARRTPAFTTVALLLLACVAQLALFSVWFEFGERHREFLTPFLLLLITSAASGWQFRRRASRDYPAALPA